MVRTMILKRNASVDLDSDSGSDGDSENEDEIQRKYNKMKAEFAELEKAMGKKGKQDQLEKAEVPQSLDCGEQEVHEEQDVGEKARPNEREVEQNKQDKEEGDSAAATKEENKLSKEEINKKREQAAVKLFNQEKNDEEMQFIMPECTSKLCLFLKATSSS